MKISLQKLGVIKGGQDGSIFGEFLFRFGSFGTCRVYKIKDLLLGGEFTLFSTFTLDRANEFPPHSNSVAFGVEYYDKNDEFPLLYTNAYNNFYNKEDDLRGVTFVYRLTRKGNEFSTTLVQVIKIGFTSDAIWKSLGNDVRPYGNFAIDKQSEIYYAFTMRDESNTTEYFAFNLPKLNCGIYDEKFGVNVVTLRKNDVLFNYSAEYHRYLQGACAYNGYVYSVEGFTNSVENPSAMRVIDVKNKQSKLYYNFAENGYPIEAEFIEFYNGECYYSDNHGNLYIINFN